MRIYEVSAMGFRTVAFLRRWPIFALTILASTACNASAQDRLEPERGSVNEPVPLASLAHYLELHKTLLRDAAFHYRARVVCEPFGPRWVVTLICEDRERPAYFVEYAGFEDRKDGGYRIRKARASLDREAAEAVQEVWLRMLRAVRYPDVPRNGADGVTYHFSRFVPLGLDDPLAPGGWEAGQIWTPDPTSTTGRLASIGVAMRDFAMAPPEKRTGLRGRILKQAVALKSDLDKRPKPAEKMP
jgi:hypothetical protein